METIFKGLCELYLLFIVFPLTFVGILELILLIINKENKNNANRKK